MHEKNEDNRTHKVVVNHEEQYSIWLADRENVLGWNDREKERMKQVCLDYMGEVWTDVRPLSVRRYMEEFERKQKRKQKNKES